MEGTACVLFLFYKFASTHWESSSLFLSGMIPVAATPSVTLANQPFSYVERTSVGPYRYLILSIYQDLDVLNSDECHSIYRSFHLPEFCIIQYAHMPACLCVYMFVCVYDVLYDCSIRILHASWLIASSTTATLHCS